MANDNRSSTPTGVGAKPWIKMRTDLWDDPRVSALCDTLETDEARIIGGLYRLWSIADAHSTDGELVGMTMPSVDRKCGIPGLAKALESIGWLTVHETGVTIPDFIVHNGQSAKSRAQNSLRQQVRRATQSRDSDASRSKRDTKASTTRHPCVNGGTREDESRDLEKNSEEPPPPPSKAVSSGPSKTEPVGNADSVVAVEEILRKAGLAAAAQTASEAIARNYSVDQVQELAEELKRRTNLGAGALAFRIRNVPPGEPVSDGWPEPAAAKPPVDERSREAEWLSRHYKSDLDLMSDNHVIDLAERAGIDDARDRITTRGKGILFPDELTRVLREVARDNAALSADRDRRVSAGTVAAAVPQTQAQPERRPREPRTEAV